MPATAQLTPARFAAQARSVLHRYRDRRASRMALASLGSAFGPLPASVRRRAREDAIERLGDSRHACWLMAYATAAREFRDGWLPVGYFETVVAGKVNGKAAEVTETRALAGRMFCDPAVPDVIYRVNGLTLDATCEVIEPAEACEKLRAAAETIVFKADGSHSGGGTHSIVSSKLTSDALSRVGNGVFQPLIEAHPCFAPFRLTALPTLRIGTVIRDDGSVEPRCCYLKLGRRAHDHNRATDQIRVAIDWRSGALAEHGFTSGWQPVKQHPDGGPAFASVTLPVVHDAVSASLRLHRLFPLARFLFWDMAVDSAGQPQLLEWERGRVHFAEAAQGPCFADLGWDRLHLQSSGRTDD